MTMTSISPKPRFTQISISDIHLGHHNTPTDHVINNLRTFLPDNEEMGEVDIIWFVGDVFDRALYVHSDDVIETKIWINDFLRMCKRRNIMVRVLEGTPSHDWKQSLLFQSANEQGEIGVDLKYVTSLSIEYIEKLGIHALYVPDEWLGGDTEATWREVRQLMAAEQIEQVDYVLLHGSFAYQLPSHVTSPKHEMERYLSITRKTVFCGHVHLNSVYTLPDFDSRILSNGSFDRLCHGEEGRKGYWRVVDYGSEPDEIRFIENTGAAIYKTINCTGKELDEALAYIEQEARYLPDGSRVRIQAAAGEPVLSSLSTLHALYTNIDAWTTKQIDRSEVQKNLMVDMRSTFQQINITHENIVGLVMERMAGLTDDPATLSAAREAFAELVHA